MATVVVSFEIKDTDKQAYDRRYKALLTRMRELGAVKTETTSLLQITTAHSQETLHSALYGCLDFRKDKALTFTVSALVDPQSLGI